MFKNRLQELFHRDKILDARLRPLSTALLSQNPVLIQNRVISPVDQFSIALGNKKEDYFIGTSAVNKLAETPIHLACFQAFPDNDLSTIAAVAHFGGKNTGAIVALDPCLFR